MDSTTTVKPPSRNYQLDFMKLLASFLVFANHTDCFIQENTKGVTQGYLGRLGYWGVFFFFIVSGLLMVHHYI